jgi:hypothetical protein
MERKEKRGKVDEQAWLSKGAAILTDIKEWRRAHPKATFVEIEDEIHRRMMELEAQVLQDAAQESLSREWGQTPGPSGSPSSTSAPKDPAGCLAQQSLVHSASRGCSSSPCPPMLSPKANPEASKTTTEAPVCRSCGTPVMRVQGQRKRLYCSDTCRARASRVRCPTDSSPRTLPERIKQEVLTRLPHTPIKRLGSPPPSPRPFVKERTDRCPCGTPVVVVPGVGIGPGCIVQLVVACERFGGGEQNTAYAHPRQNRSPCRSLRMGDTARVPPWSHEIPRKCPER